MNKCYKILMALVLSLSSIGYCSAGDAKAGKAKAGLCFGCHGAQGISVMPQYPNLAGQKEQYLVSAINSYRNGGRNDPTMKAMTASLTDDDVANIAAFFSSLPGK
jgi:cytochrome c553